MGLASLQTSTTNRLDSFNSLFQSLAAEKEDRAVFELHDIGIRWLTLENRRLLALSSPKADDDRVAHGKACHLTTSCRLLVDFFGSEHTLPGLGAGKGDCVFR